MNETRRAQFMKQESAIVDIQRDIVNDSKAVFSKHSRPKEVTLEGKLLIIESSDAPLKAS